MSTLVSLKDQLEALSYVATIVGIVIALIVFWSEKRKVRLAREAEAYFRTNDRQVQYLTLCLDHMDAKAFDPDTAATGVETKRLIMFSILLNTFETAYLSLRSSSRRILNRQWQGWENYIRMWGAQEDFVKTWKVIGTDFDADFQKYMNALIRPLPTKPPVEALHNPSLQTGSVDS